MGSHVDELVEALSTAVQRQAAAGAAVVAVDDDAERFVAVHAQHVRSADGRQFADVVVVVALDEQFGLVAFRHLAVDAAQERQRRRSHLKSGGTEKFRLAPSALAKFLHICSYIWAPAEIFPEGRKTTHTLKINHFFGARKTKTTICAFFTDSTLILQKYICIFIF